MVLAALWLLVGCAAHRDASTAHYESYSYEDDDVMMAMEPMPERASANRGRGQAKSNSVASIASAPPAAAASFSDSSQREDVVAPSTQRMVHYNGYLELRVTKADESTASIKAMIEEMGGYVESSSNRHVTVRVPVKAFPAAMEQTMALGDVLSRSVTAEDVTESYTAIDLRLQTARATRDRLVELLARAKDESEKIALLKQIQRVNEEIDVTESKLRTLASLASYSRLSISLVTRDAFADRSHREDAVGLEWIQALTPFRRDVGSDGRRLSIETPDGLVVLSTRGRFVAESADGAVLWTGRLPNEPQGDADFWIEAIESRLASEFATAEITTVGEWTMLRLVSDGEEPYRYLVGLIEDGKKLKLVEIYYPGEAQEQRYGDDILTSLRGGEG
jgi:hypothetical protein